ncbi:MAG: hypothetical protein IT330_15020 [Anaerolineae bacterium]|nr:hypothetical protein [Anaerolineae bacterium]
MSRKLFLLLAVCVLALVGGSAIFAAPDSPTTSFAIPWWTTEGGDTSSGGPYTLVGVIGQPDAGSQSGGSYALRGGFLVSIPTFHRYLPLIQVPFSTFRRYLPLIQR